MDTTRGSFEEKERDGVTDTAPDALDTLLSHAPRYAPPAGFADRVMAAIHEEEAAASAPAAPRHWHLRPYTWAGAAAACLAAIFCLLPELPSSAAPSADALAVDDALLVDEAMDAIDDPDLVYAICSVSVGF